MTRVLSELLGAEQPRFGMVIRKLEDASGKPSADVRLTSEILQRTQHKLRLLGLDPHDTTSEELYQALMGQFQRDEILAQETLHLSESAASHDITTASIKYIEKNIGTPTAFALKNSVARRLLKKVPLKRTMKHLGYRSLDSMLKHEAPAHLYVAAFFYESLTWRKKFFEQYKDLRPSDFELRPIEVSMPQATRWNDTIEKITASQHPLVVLKELGAVVVLPGATVRSVIALIILISSAINDIQSTASFLKLQQMKPDFGAFVHGVAEHEPLTQAELAGRSVPWRVVHQYYARFKEAYNPLIFEPHIHPEDLKWLHPETLLAKLHPAIDFWRDTRYTAHLHNEQKVSLNIFDVAQAYISRLTFPNRDMQALRRALWQELMIRYLDRANVEHAIAGDLVVEPVFAEIEDHPIV